MEFYAAYALPSPTFDFWRRVSFRKTILTDPGESRFLRFEGNFANKLDFIRWLTLYDASSMECIACGT
jgi:hypothetical protein